MHERLISEIDKKNTLHDARVLLHDIFGEVRARGYQQIGYVSGMISSEGKEKIPQNLKRLARYTDIVRSVASFPIFSPTDVCRPKFYATVNGSGATNDHWMEFWREVLGHEERFVTDIFMTPRWELSIGARDEHILAKEVGMRIHYLYF